MSGFKAFYAYYLTNTLFFTYKKNPVGIFFSEKNKVRDKCIDIWNERHVNSDGFLFLKMEKEFPERTLPLIFITNYLQFDNCHPSAILNKDKEVHNKLMIDAQNWQAILKEELPKLKAKELNLKNSNIVTQAICYDIFGVKDKSTNSLEKEVTDKYRTKVKNMSLLLKHYWPREFETDRVRRYIKMFILKRES